MLSHNPNDARERYCGNCHRFVDDAGPWDLAALEAWIRAEMQAVWGMSETTLRVLYLDPIGYRSDTRVSLGKNDGR
jgi:hypothetical protein